MDNARDRATSFRWLCLLRARSNALRSTRPLPDEMLASSFKRPGRRQGLRRSSPVGQLCLGQSLPIGTGYSSRNTFSKQRFRFLDGRRPCSSDLGVGTCLCPVQPRQRKCRWKGPRCVLQLLSVVGDNILIRLRLF
jgi:hypothetical protein